MVAHTQELIVKLLSNLGSSKEVSQYLKHYASVEQQRFAIIKVGGAIVRDQLDTLASSLTFLTRVGLTPIVIHGAGPQLNAALAEAGIATERKEGLRITTPRVLQVARKVFTEVNLSLVDALEALGTRARPITSGVFEAEQVADDELGLVGQVRAIHREPLRAAVRAGHLPILACLGETADGQILNINADVAARELALDIEPHKIIFLTDTGGLLDASGRVISAINLTEDFAHLMEQPWVAGGMRLKLQELKNLLDALPETSSVSLTAPGHLAKELFTHKGSGTLIRQGERIDTFDSFANVDTTRLQGLLETVFGRALSADYFDKKPAHRVFLSDSYRATAVVTAEPLTVNGETVCMPYLDKFAVTTAAQGAGLGSSLWHRMKDAHPQLFWRSRANNAINTWYFQQSTGSYRNDDWAVFWYGIDDYDTIRACVEHALAMPASLAETTRRSEA